MSHPSHLDPSELGTKEYWDHYYQNDLENTSDHGLDSDDGDEDPSHELTDPSDLESWFDDVGAPAKILKFLTSDSFPLSPSQVSKSSAELPSVLDLGTGNGSALFSLRLEGGYQGEMVGVDYSRPSIDLARRLRQQYETPTRSNLSTNSTGSGIEDGNNVKSIKFEVFDLIQDDPKQQPWWPSERGGFDLVLDKGTFDAISLSSETVTVSQGLNGPREVRICELYPARTVPMLRIGGYLLITSCNWTQDELIAWFTQNEGSDIGGKLEVFDTLKFPIFQFGGQKGQGVASVCFKRIS